MSKEADSGEVVQLRGMWASPAVHRVAWALRLKGVEEDLERKSPALLELNPITKQVPVLVHGGRPVVESLVILEYIDEVWSGAAGAPPLLPENPYERARARFLAAFVEDKSREATRKVFFAPEKERGEGLRSLEEILEVLEKELKSKEGEFFGGRSIGYLDLAVGWMPFWLGVVLEGVLDCKVMNAIKFPTFYLWSKFFLQNPPEEKWESIITLPPREKAIEYFIKYRQLYSDSPK
ncbi:Glutathione transferase GST 23 [Apostasia shenzhenica]|uniref:Glutathione S-transferase n=1 Tax=Apostasia shenzhenica TaxID=1088818 RepID=A0A2I0B3Y0_9ASPA|nr:Glutathione transferase GST 23 [Apostasia shenzhenica]